MSVLYREEIACLGCLSILCTSNIASAIHELYKSVYVPLVLVPVFLEGASNSKYMVQGNQDRQSLPNMLKHSLQLRTTTNSVIVKSSEFFVY